MPPSQPLRHRLLPLLCMIAAAVFAAPAAGAAVHFEQAGAAATTPKTPIVLIPGDGASQIEARLDGKPSVPHVWCSSKTADFYPIWLNMELLTAFAIDCLVDDFRLVFDPATNMTANAPKVVTRVPNFGDTSTVEYFDSSRFFASAYFNDLAARLVDAGYARNQSLRGAPFDFRKGVHDNQGFLADLKSLIESTCAANGGRPALLVAHSYGNNMALAFLQSQSADWKRRYVRAMMAVSAPLGGAVKTLRLMASGDSLNNPLEWHLQTAIRPLQRSLTSTAYLMPHPSFWSADEVLVSRPERNYTSRDYGQFFKDIGYPEGELLREAAVAGYRPEVPPGVEVFCIHGTGLEAPGTLVWPRSSDWPDTQPDVVWDEGDGTVNARSLRACAEVWGAPGAQQQPVHNFTIAGGEHLKILHMPEFLNYAMEIINRLNDEASSSGRSPASGFASASAANSASDSLL